MKILYPCCCGLDVHAKTVVACLIAHGQKQTKTFGTMTADLLALADWLAAAGCTHVAIESTGVYWRPVYNLLEGFITVVLANARHVKAVPGRKTDVKDCEWLADLLQHGLLKASFVPPRPTRELRELTRYRQSLLRDQASLANRIQKVLESGNIKLGQVASDVLGVSGRQMLRALVAGETDAQQLAELAKRRMRSKLPQLRLALEGCLTGAQRFVVGELVDRYEEVEAAVARVNEEVEKTLAQRTDPALGEAVVLLQSAPGVGARLAEIIVSEMGADMERFPSDKHLCSWAGVCPGNNESAGKRRSGQTTKGNLYLRAALVQAAWAATRTRGAVLAALYQRLVRRLGKKKALLAVAHRLLRILYHMLKSREPYQETISTSMDEQHRARVQKQLIKKLEALGFKVAVELVEPQQQVPSRC